MGSEASLQGILAFHTPSTFGGGPEAALPLVMKARNRLDLSVHPSEGIGPSWGWLDASAWVGQTYAALGRIDDARRVYEETLAREPNMAWIKQQLLPALTSK
jgi:hypothetical protein